MGGALVYYVVFPLATRFFLSFETPVGETPIPIEFEGRVSEYLSLMMSLIFAFGVFFQLPILLTLLARAGIVSADGLASKRRYAIVALFVAARDPHAARHHQSDRPRAAWDHPLRGLDHPRPDNREEACGKGRRGARRGLAGWTLSPHRGYNRASGGRCEIALLMLDLRWIRDNPEALDDGLAKRGASASSAEILALDAKRRAAQTRFQELQQERNETSKKIGGAKRAARMPSR